MYIYIYICTQLCISKDYWATNLNIFSVPICVSFAGFCGPTSGFGEHLPDKTIAI